MVLKKILDAGMTRACALLLLILTSFPVCCQTFDDLKRRFLSDDGLYIEKPSGTDPDRYSLDNKIYAIGKKFVFDYYILTKKGDSLKIKTPKVIAEDADFQKTWSLVPSRLKDSDKIEFISMSVNGSMVHENQTSIQYEFHYTSDGFTAASGLVENKLNTWIRPPKDKYFMILQLNPFPFIQEPFDKGYHWTWTLPISDRWQDSRWKSWKGTLRNIYEYRIIGKETLNTKLGELDCWVVQGGAVSAAGVTGLISYFHEVYGFVKLEYTNIDKSQLIMELRQIK